MKLAPAQLREVATYRAGGHPSGGEEVRTSKSAALVPKLECTGVQVEGWRNLRSPSPARGGCVSSSVTGLEN